MPFGPLTEPTVLQTLTHLKADDFVTELHQIVENSQVWLLQFAVKQMALHDVSRRMPLLLLPQQLALLELCVFAHIMIIA